MLLTTKIINTTIVGLKKRRKSQLIHNQLVMQNWFWSSCDAIFKQPSNCIACAELFLNIKYQMLNGFKLLSDEDLMIIEKCLRSRLATCMYSSHAVIANLIFLSAVQDVAEQQCLPDQYQTINWYMSGPESYHINSCTVLQQPTL